jgi:hypothetical protein
MGFVMDFTDEERYEHWWSQLTPKEQYKHYLILERMYNDLWGATANLANEWVKKNGKL